MLRSSQVRIARWILSLVLMIAGFCHAESARGDLIVTIDDATFSPASGGVLDVWISSTGSNPLAFFDFEFRVEALGDTATQLRFVNPQSDQQLLALNYVFSTSSLKRDGDSELSLPPGAVGTVGTSQFSNDTFRGLDGGLFTVGASSMLLARLELEAADGFLAPTIGDSFRVQLVASPFTSFLDPDATTISYTSSGGLITVVPEPSGLFGAMLLFGIAHFRRRTK